MLLKLIRYYWPAYWASIVLLAGVCRLSSSVTVSAGGRAGRRVCGRSAAAGPGAWAVERLTLHGGPVRLRRFKATPCLSAC